MIGRIAHRMRDSLRYMGLGLDELRQVRPLVDDGNRRDLASWSAFVGIYMIVSLLLSLRSAAFEACRPIYIASLLACSLTLAYSKILHKRYPQCLPTMIGLFSISTFALGLGIAFYQPDIRSVTMVAIAIILPICFIVPTTAMIVLQVLTFVAFVVMGRGVLAPDVYSFGVLTLFLFSVLGTAIGHRINKARFERLVYAASIERLAEMQTRYAYYDQLTGLQNRRAYTERIDDLAGMGEKAPDDIHIVMIDLNGLKEMNDEHGHKAGDEMLIGAAECLSATFGNFAYRLGGDEFSVVMSATDDDMEILAASMVESMAAWEGEYVHGISVSYGIGSCHGHGCDPEAAAKEADQRMYENKRAYYEQAGIDRRRRRRTEDCDGCPGCDRGGGDGGKVACERAAASDVPSEDASEGDG